MDQDLYKLSRPTMAQTNAMPSVGSVQTANKLIAGGGGSSTGLSGPNAVNEQISMQQSDRARLQNEKRMMRHSTKSTRAQTINNFVTQNETLLSTNPENAATHRIDLRNPIGATFDGTFNEDRPLYSPQAKLVAENARKQLKQEFASMLAGSNKQGWNSLDDLNEAINGLDTVKKYGPLVEDLANQLARSAVSSDMNAKFAANDANVRSFVEWAKKKGLGLTDDALAERFNDSDILRSEFESDPNTVKYDAVGDKVVPRQITPDQQEQMRVKGEAGDMLRKRAIFEEQAARDPDYAKQHGFDPFSSAGVFKREAKPPTVEAAQASVDAKNKAYKDNGINRKVVLVPQADGTSKEMEIEPPLPSVYPDRGNVAFRSKSDEEKEKIILEIMENDALAASGDMASRAKATARAASLRKMYQEEGEDLTEGGSAVEASGGEKALDAETATKYLERAAGDPAKAREMAKADGWSF